MIEQDMVQVATSGVEQECDHRTTEARVWAARITECWRSSVEAIIRCGHLLIEAKDAVPHGAWGDVLAGLPFGERTAQRLMAIAQDNRLSNPTHVSLLPASWGTLYELTKLTDDEFTEAVQQHVIRPDMLRGEAELIRPLTHRVPSSDGRTDEAMARESDPTVGIAAHRAEALEPRRDDQAGMGSERSSPSETQMPSGGLAIAHPRVEPRDGLDFFPTPPWATRALFEHVLVHLERRQHCKFQRAWEPACGQGHMAETMREYFREVHATDVNDYGAGYFITDFLNIPNEENLIANDWIITNPPFNTSADFVLKALKLAGTGVAMFVRAAWLEGVDRYERVFRDNPPTLISFFTERVPLHKGRWEPDGATFTAYIWLVWIKGAEPRAPFWIPPVCRKTLLKPDDVKRFGKSAEGEAA